MTSLPPSQSPREPFLSLANIIRAAGPVQHPAPPDALIKAHKLGTLWCTDPAPGTMSRRFFPVWWRGTLADSHPADDKDDYRNVLVYHASLLAGPPGPRALPHPEHPPQEHLMTALATALAPVNAQLQQMSTQLGRLEERLEEGLGRIEWRMSIVAVQVSSFLPSFLPSSCSLLTAVISERQPRVSRLQQLQQRLPYHADPERSRSSFASSELSLFRLP